MKIALLGTGFAQAHAPVYAQRPDVDEVIVFGRTSERLAAIRDQFGFATTTNLDSVISDDDVDLVDIACLPGCTPRMDDHLKTTVVERRQAKCAAHAAAVLFHQLCLHSRVNRGPHRTGRQNRANAAASISKLGNFVMCPLLQFGSTAPCSVRMSCPAIRPRYRQPRPWTPMHSRIGQCCPSCHD